MLLLSLQTGGVTYAIFNKRHPDSHMCLHFILFTLYLVEVSRRGPEDAEGQSRDPAGHRGRHRGAGQRRVRLVCGGGQSSQ